MDGDVVVGRMGRGWVVMTGGDFLVSRGLDATVGLRGFVLV